jgi:hypothetical protein
MLENNFFVASVFAFEPREAGGNNRKKPGKLKPRLLTTGADTAIMIADGTVPLRFLLLT